MSEYDRMQRAFNELAMDLAGELAEATSDLDLTVPAPTPEAPAIPQAPAGFGVVDIVEARKALDEARNSGDVQKTLDAHNAWLDLAEELPSAVERARQASVRAVYKAAGIGALGGFGVGFGMATLLRVVIG